MREETILRKLRARDPAGLEGLMDRYLPYVSAVVWGILRGAMTAEDGEEVASDVFLAAWEQSGNLRAGRVKAWLGAVARNKAKNKLRQAGHTLALEEDALELPGPDDPAGALERAEEAVSPQDTGYILYTSGTTSMPKAVMSSQYSRVNSAIQQAHDLEATEHDRFCVAMPIFHCFCLSVNVMAACAAGACLYLPESRRTTVLLEAVAHGRCTVLSSVPTMYHAILCRPDLSSWDLSSLRTGFIGGSFYPAELFRQIDGSFGFTLLSSLGQTEATAGLTTARLDDPLEVRASTVGHFMDHVEGKIVDIESGKDQPPGRAGEICVRGYLVMQGYFGQPEETRQAIDKDGWLHGLAGRSRKYPPHRAAEGADHPGGREHLPRRGGTGRRLPRDPGVQGGGRPRPALRRRGVPVRRPPRGRGPGRGGAALPAGPAPGRL